jgi:hypothetical protein
MERIITIKNGVGLFDSSTFYVSDNEDVKIYVKRADGKALKNYRMLVKHGELRKTFTLFGEGVIELKAKWLNKNNNNVEFELVLLDNVGVNTISSEIVEIEPLQIKELQGKFEYSALVQSLAKWQEQHGKRLDELEKRFASYECNGTILETE